VFLFFTGMILMYKTTSYTPQTRPAPVSKALGDYFPGRFIKADDLIRWKVNDVTVTVSNAQEEEVRPHRNRPPDWRLVLYFKTKTGEQFPRGYLVSAKADIQTLKDAGFQAVGDLLNHQLIISLADHNGQATLRLSVPR